MDLIVALILATATASVAVPVVVTPSGIELEKLADNTMVPGIVGSYFFIETRPPEACGEKVLFNGFDERARLGLYASSAADGIELVADTTVLLPGSAATFQNASEMRCLGRQAFFRGSGTEPRNPRSGVFSWLDNEINALLEPETLGGELTLRAVQELDVNEAGIVTVATFLSSSISEGVLAQRFGGGPFIVADDATILPDRAEPATSFRSPVAVGRDVVFVASTGLISGIYRWNEAAGLSLLVDSTSPVPALGNLPFTVLVRITSLDEGVVFSARFAGGNGIFLFRDGIIEPLVLPGDMTVDGETLPQARSPRGAGKLLVFDGAARTFGQSAFVRLHDGSIKRLLAQGETLGGLRVDGVIADADRESVALRVGHGPDSQAVYRARFPAPAAATTEIPTLSELGFVLMGLGLALAGLGIVRRAAPGV